MRQRNIVVVLQKSEPTNSTITCNSTRKRLLLYSVTILINTGYGIKMLRQPAAVDMCSCPSEYRVCRLTVCINRGRGERGRGSGRGRGWRGERECETYRLSETACRACSTDLSGRVGMVVSSAAACVVIQQSQSRLN